jgi:hypothetical protein
MHLVFTELASFFLNFNLTLLAKKNLANSYYPRRIFIYIRRAPPITERLDVSKLTEATYKSFMTGLDSAVRRTTDDLVLDRPLLGEQRLWTTPVYWIHVELMVSDATGQRRLLTLAVRSDNLYVSGFANRDGKWFAFKGQEDKLPGSTALSYTGDYADIFGTGGYRGLGSVQVNRARALANADLLADYRSGPDAALKPALGFFILTISEAERFPTLRAALGRAMDASKPQTMGETLARLAVNWKRLSCALRAWDRFGKTMDVWNANTEARELRTQQIGVTTPTDALNKILPLLRAASGRKDCTWTG